MVGGKFIADRYCNGTGQVIRLKQTAIVRTIGGPMVNWRGRA